MRIAAMAAGGVGGYYGAKLAAAGHDVFFIARGAHKAAIEANGLKVESVNGDIHIAKANVTDDPATIGPVDVVLFAVKLWDTEKAAEACRPLLGPNTRVITMQNGVDSYERIAPIVGAERAVPGGHLRGHRDRSARRHQAGSVNSSPSSAAPMTTGPMRRSRPLSRPPRRPRSTSRSRTTSSATAGTNSSS